MATHTQVHSSDTSRKAKRRAQERAKRRVWKSAVWSLAGLIGVAACGELAYADIAATPRSLVSFNPKTNLVQVQLVAGEGWLANWMLAHSKLQARADHFSPGRAPDLGASTGSHRKPSSGTVTLPIGVHTWTEAVKPSETVRVTTTVSGPLLKQPSATQTVQVPIAPAVASTHVTAMTETVRFNTPVASVKVLSGKQRVQEVSSHSVALTRETTSYTAHLQVTALSGEVSSLVVHVPALPPPPVTVQTPPPVDTTLVPPVSPVPEYFFGNPSGNRVYITIDDGWYPDPQVITLMQQTHVPLTAFLIDAAAQEHIAFWKAFVAAGGTIGDHTDTHPWLSHISAQSDVYQWHQPVVDDQKWFGVTPVVGRPPYGDVNKTVLEAAHAAGLKAIVMWSAEFNPSNPAQGMSTWNGQPLTAGEIILLHWQPGLYSQLKQVLAICKERGLVPAPLTSGLPGLGGN